MSPPETNRVTPSLSLPRGGGAIRGIGEKFSANPVTGTGSLSIPIFTTPGRSGFGPQLSLSYDSGAGNGAFGLGWGIGLPSITRRTDKGIPRYADAEDSDVFILSGTEDLVPVTGPGAGTLSVRRYRPRTEGLFARIERCTDGQTGEQYWRTISGDNITSIYGSTDNSRIADPADKSRVYCWLISESHDDKGNAIVYEYRSENSAGVDKGCVHEQNRTDTARAANRYLKSIRYGNKRPYVKGEDLQSRTDWMFEVVFDYGEHDPVLPTTCRVSEWAMRQDPFSSCRPGFEVRTYRLCRRILMFHHFPDELDIPDYLVRSMDLTYRASPVASLVVSLAESGYTRKNGSYVKKSLPPVEFTYSEAVLRDKVETLDPESLKNLPVGLDNASYRWIDLDGDGISGVLTEQGEAWYYKPNLGGGRLGETRPVASVPSTADIGSGRQLLMDLAGAGKLDLVKLAAPVNGFYERTVEGGWDHFTPFPSLPGIQWDDPGLMFVDLTGDGLADVLVAEGEAFTWYPSRGRTGFGPSEKVHLPGDEEKGPQLIFADGTQSVYLADMSGDGLSDIVRICNGEISYWPNLGYGKFGARVTMDHSPVFDAPDLFSQARVRLADVDGSGTTDIIYLRHDRVDVYPNLSGNRWGDPQSLRQFPPVDDLSTVATVDLFGNGTGCLVWSTTLPGMGSRQVSYIRLTGDVKPHLLVGLTNNMGSETVVQYAASTAFYLADKAAGTPWVTRLPFPVHVVTRVDTYDRISRNLFVTRYKYHHGYYDGVEREFRGFGMVEQLDTEEFAALSGSDAFPDPANVDAMFNVPPVLTKTWYHTGVYLQGEAISHRIAREYYGAPGPGSPGYDHAFDAFLRTLLPDTVLPEVLTAEEEREACRAMRGSVLRQEVFARDGTDNEAIPYKVSEKSYEVRLLQHAGPGRHGVFLVHPRETLEYYHERNPDDPRISHAMTLEADEFGNVTKSVAIAYGRRQADSDLDRDDLAKQTTPLITYAESMVTNNVDEVDDYRTPLPCESRTYELTGFTRLATQARYCPEDFLVLKDGKVERINGKVQLRFDAEAGSGADPAIKPRQRRLIGHARTLYRDDGLNGLLGLGKLEPRALPGESYRLAFTPGTLDAVYRRPSDQGPPEDFLGDREALLRDTGCYILSHDYKSARDYQSDALFPAGDPDDHWWAPSGRIYYSPEAADDPGQELDFAGRHFYLPHRFEDLHGNRTIVAYDSDETDPDKNYGLLAVSTCDPLGNTVSARNDYRVMLPSSVTDPNGTVSEALFDALGQVVATAIRKGGEGDSIGGVETDLTQERIDAFFADPGNQAAALLGKATSYVIYEQSRYYRTGDPGKPPYVASIAGKTHDNDPVPEGGRKVRVSFSYSDGFGREIQEKLPAEPGPVNGVTASSRWTGDGWTIFNNKGKPVRQYEPFFDDTHEFRFGRAEGVSSVLFYDPVGRLVAALHPNHTYEKTVFGPWKQAAFDVNDTVAFDPWTDPDVAGYVSGYLRQVAPQPGGWGTWLRMQNVDPLAPPEDGPGLEPGQKAAVRTLAHADTPSIAHVDPAGRTFLTVADNGKGGKFRMRAMTDIKGNLREIRDALDRPVMKYDYDMLGNLIRQESVDSGTRWMLHDAAGGMVFGWDSLGRTVRRTYDALRRQTRLWIKEGDGNEQLVELVMYGEMHPDSNPSGGNPAPRSLNLRGRAFLVLDGAGMVVNCAPSPRTGNGEAYDFKGNLLRSTRRCAKEYRQRPDWKFFDDRLNQAIAGQQGAVALGPDALTSLLADLDAALEPEGFTGSTRYDALNRPVQSIAPHSDRAGAGLNVVQPAFNEAGLLGHVDVWPGLDAEPAGLLEPATASQHVIAGVDYDAKGQRELVAYGNGVKTRYDYDPETFRLIGLRTSRGTGFPEDCGKPVPCADPPGSCPKPGDGACGVQNISYTYDPVGNIVYVRDDAMQTIYFSGSVVRPESDYTYDALYRLVRASGREHLGSADTPWPAWGDGGRTFRQQICDPKLMRNYTEQYFYDRSGNFERIDHKACNGNGTNPNNWIRTFVVEPDLADPGKKNSNRLVSCMVGSETENFSYDAHGNMTSMPHLPALSWDYKDQLQAAHKDKAGRCIVYFTYDAGGQRVRKVVEQDGRPLNERIYAGSCEVYRKYAGTRSDPSLERISLRVMDDGQCIALIDTKTIDAKNPDVTLPETLVRYQLGNHLGSAALELDERAGVISYEEYYPYGSTSYQAMRSNQPGSVEVSTKRYRYTGKERDEETGLYYYGARYYAPWLGQWISFDQDLSNLPVSPYAYCENSPVSKIDDDGLDPKPVLKRSDLVLTNEHTANKSQNPGKAVDANNLTHYTARDNSFKGTKPEGPRPKATKVNLKAAEGTKGEMKAAQDMLKGSYADTEELNRIWLDSSTNQCTGKPKAYSTSASPFNKAFLDTTNEDVRLAVKFYEMANIKVDPVTGERYIDFKVSARAEFWRDVLAGDLPMPDKAPPRVKEAYAKILQMLEPKGSKGESGSVTTNTALGMAGMALLAYSLYKTGVALNNAREQSLREGSDKPLQDELIRQGAAWGFGIAATEALAMSLKGTCLGAEVGGPWGAAGGFLLGLGVGFVTSYVGYQAADKYIELRDADPVEAWDRNIQMNFVNEMGW